MIQGEAYVPLLYIENMLVHSWPEVARRLTITARMFSNTDIGTTNFHKSGLLLPIVVSMVTFELTTTTKKAEQNKLQVFSAVTDGKYSMERRTTQLSNPWDICTTNK